MRVVSLVTLCDLLHSCQGVQCSLQPHAEIQQNYVHKVMRTYMSRCELQKLSILLKELFFRADYPSSV